MSYCLEMSLCRVVLARRGLGRWRGAEGFLASHASGMECEWCREDVLALYGFGSSLPWVLGWEGCGVTPTLSPWGPQSLPWVSQWPDTFWSFLAPTCHVTSFSFPFLLLIRDHLSSSPELFPLPQGVTLTPYCQIHCSPKLHFWPGAHVGSRCFLWACCSCPPELIPSIAPCSGTPWQVVISHLGIPSQWWPQINKMLRGENV